MNPQLQSIKYQYLHTEAENLPEQLLNLPGYFPITTNNCSISWNCLNCNSNVNLKWPISPLDSCQWIRIPSANYFNISFLKKIADTSDRFELITKKEITYVKDLETNMSPSLIIADCAKCCHQYLLSYSIGVGQESRPPEPNTFAIRNLWYIGIRENVIKGESF